MNKFKLGFLPVFLIFLFQCVGGGVYATVLTVAVYQNPPLVFTSENGEIEGFFPDLLKEIAKRENWNLEWVIGNWSDNYEKVKNGQIDLLLDVAISPERSKEIRFNAETVLINWGTLVVRKNRKIDSFVDLRDLRIALLDNDIHTMFFVKLMSDFGVRFIPVMARNYEDQLSLVRVGKADAAVLNRLYFVLEKNTHSGLIQSWIIFSPQKIHIAARFGLDRNILDRIDQNLKQMKLDESSLYYQSLHKWLDIATQKVVIPHWLQLIIPILVVLLLFFFVFVIILRRMVKVRVNMIERSEEALRRERSKLEVTLKSIGDAVVATDVEGKVVLMNPVATELMGWTEKEAVGRSLQEVFCVVNEVSGIRVKNPIEKVLSSGKIEELANNMVLISRSERHYNIENSAAPIENEEGEIIGVVMVFRDVTEKLHTEREMIRMEKLESLGVMAGGIAHDFKNILTGVYGNLSLVLRNMEDDHPMRHYIDIAVASAEKANHLSYRLITFAKGGEPLRKACDLSELIHDSLELNLSGSNVKGVFRSSDLPKIMADDGQLSQVFANLIINARQAMPDGGHLWVDAEVMKDAFVRISVRDEGNGISKELLDKIFDPYFTTKPTGNGIGLTSVHSIISKHNGKIKVESEEGKGTTFIITLPIGEDLQKEKTGLGDVQSHPVSPKNVLVLENEVIVQGVFSEILAALGHKAVVVSEGGEALKLYRGAKERGEEFDLVISDLTIPGGMGGKKLRHVLAGEKAAAKFIVASGYSDDPVVSRYRDYGFDAVLSKPFILEDLSQVMAQLFED